MMIKLYLMRLKTLLIGTIISLISLLSLSFKSVYATSYPPGSYSSGGYNNCAYQDNASCTTSGTTSSSGGSSTVPSSTTTTGSAILLNDFSEYFDGGKTLDLKVNQIIYFNVLVDGVNQKHSITIKVVGKDYVILTFASKPVDVRIDIGQTIRHDVTGDGVNDIAVTLNSITSGVANLTFEQLLPPQTNAGSTAVTTNSSNGSSFPKIILYVGLTLLGLIILIVLIIKRRHKDDNKQIKF